MTIPWTEYVNIEKVLREIEKKELNLNFMGCILRKDRLEYSTHKSFTESQMVREQQQVTNISSFCKWMIHQILGESERKHILFILVSVQHSGPDDCL